MTGSGTPVQHERERGDLQRCSATGGSGPGKQIPVHPNDHVNMSSHRTIRFRQRVPLASAMQVEHTLVPALQVLHDAIAAKAEEWKDILKIGRTHMQDATPLTLGQEWSGYAGLLADDLERIGDALKGVFSTITRRHSVGTGSKPQPQVLPRLPRRRSHGLPGCRSSARPTNSRCRVRTMRWCNSPERCARWLSSLYKVANDIRLMSCGPRAGLRS